MVFAFCSAPDGDSSARRTRSPSSSRATRRKRPSASQPFAARWRAGWARKAFGGEMTSRRRVMVVLGAAAVLLIAGRALAGIYADYLWYESLGAVALWRMPAKQTMLLEAGSALGAGLFAFANLYAVRQSVVQLVFPRKVGDIEIGEEVSGRYLLGATVGLSAILGVVLTLPQDSWTT